MSVREILQRGGAENAEMVRVHLLCVQLVIFHEKIMYVHRIPVKRGLTAKPEEWDWSRARSSQSGQDEPLKINRDSVPTLSFTDDDVRSSLLE